jgi:hypothetical protein
MQHSNYLRTLITLVAWLAGTMPASDGCRAAETISTQDTARNGQLGPSSTLDSTSGPEIPRIEVVAQSNPDKKPYRLLVKAINVFEKNRRMAPDAVMRFRVLPWHDESVMNGLTLTIRGRTVEKPVAVADDGSFGLEHDQQALDEGAEVVSNRNRASLAWRADIRTPGLPPNTRRLGDLRLECKVDLAGLGADLATGFKPLGYWIATAFVSDPCMLQHVSYAWFADQPVFSITAVSGSRQQTLPSAALHGINAQNIDNNAMDWHDHLRNRFYYLPVWDTSWPDDTLLTFEAMEDAADKIAANPTRVPPAGLLVPSKTTKAEVIAAIRTGRSLQFDDGLDVWVYQFKEGLPKCLESLPVGGRLTTNLVESGKELRILFNPQGVVKKYLLLDITAPL